MFILTDNSNYMRRHLKSPFILAVVGGVSALVADVAWLAGELLTQLGVFTIEFYLIWRFTVLIALVISIVICIKGIKQYLSKGYVREECRIESEHKNYLQNRKLARKIKKELPINND